MPRSNDVFVVGLVSQPVSTQINKAGEVVQAALQILLIHGQRQYGETQTENSASYQSLDSYYDNVYLLTENPDLIREFQQCQVYDIVEAKGALRVSGNNRKVQCSNPACNEKIIYFANRTTIYPIHFARRASFAAKYGSDAIDMFKNAVMAQKIRDAALRYLNGCIEISNRVRLIGAICKEPQLYKNYNTQQFSLTFPLAVKRKYFIREDSATDNVDFVYIKILGLAAQMQAQWMHKGNLIMIDGFVRNRAADRNIVCPQCGEKTKVKATVSEVIPYSTELLRTDVSNTEFVLRKELLIPQYIGSDVDPNIHDHTVEESVKEKIMGENAQDVIKTIDSSILTAIQSRNED